VPDRAARRRDPVFEIVVVDLRHGGAKEPEQHGVRADQAVAVVPVRQLGDLGLGEAYASAERDQRVSVAGADEKQLGMIPMPYDRDEP
jgi:hypothetical protein